MAMPAFRQLLAGGVPPGFEELLPARPPCLVHCPPLPDEGSVYDFLWDPKTGDQGKGEWACMLMSISSTKLPLAPYCCVCCCMPAAFCPFLCSHAPALLATGAGSWAPWVSVTPALAIPSNAAFNDIIVPTIDTAR
jgi:hypothetical protein